MLASKSRPKVYRILALSSAAAAILSGAAGAQTVYTSLSSFQAAASGLTDVNFNGIVTPGGFTGFATPPGYTDPTTGVNFNIANAIPGDYINITSATYYAPGTIYPNDFLIPAGSTRPTTIEAITLPTGVTALGLDIGSFNGGPFVYSFSNGGSYTESSVPGIGQLSFLGFTFTTPVTSVMISTGADIPVIDDFQFGTAITPEPTSLVFLTSTGLAGMGLLARRRRSIRN